MLSRPLLDRVAFFGISWYAILITGAIVIGYLLASGRKTRLISIICVLRRIR